ncbi:InlB B-repeat-containing protein [uncultured Tenacibaculum sp.]|uniref:InlB B-repeat-containing protein n=1 Tax=uncultured Tenacibaculum sp. TaxID=174713 RepID=UPI00261F8EEC|nr:InlB B-repeat-containing protein [uncultured Tenacibaculum sp.]
MLKKILLMVVIPLCVGLGAQTRVYSGFPAGKGIAVINDMAYTMVGSELKSVSLTQSNPTEQVVSSGYNNSPFNNIAFQGTMIYREGNSCIIPGGGVSKFAYAYPSGSRSITAINGLSANALFVYNGDLYFLSKRGSFSNIEIKRYTGGTNTTVVATLPTAWNSVYDAIVVGDNLYYTSYSEGRIYRVDLSASSPSAQVFKSGLSDPWGIRHAQGYLYFIDAGLNGGIRRISVNGGSVQNVGGTIPYGRTLDIVDQDIYVLSPASVANGGGVYKYTDPNIVPVCKAPTAPQVSFVDETTADVSWTAPANSVDSYELTYVETGQSISSGTTIQNISGTSVQINNFVPGTSYDIYIKTNCTGALTATSDNVKVVYVAKSCNKPNNLRGILTGATTADITWDPVAEFVDSYELTYVDAGQPISSGTTIQNISGTTTSLTGLVNGQEYDVYVRTNCDNRFSAPSEYQKITYTQTTRVYVSQFATGSNTGGSWANAYTSLETALASNLNGKTEVWIARGTYTPSSNNRNARFEFNVDGLLIYGGFAGNETNLNQRDYLSNKTILSGDLLRNDDANVTFNNTTRSDNSLRVINVAGNNIVIDGITISGGYADATSGDGRFGAGLSLSPNISNFTIKNTTVKDNVAYWAAGLNLSADKSGSVVISVDACVFDNNLSSNSGTAMYVIPREGTNVTYFILTNSLFKNNRTTDDGSRKAKGGMVWVRAHYTGTIISTNIINNTFVNNLNEGTDANSDFATVALSRNTGSYGNSFVANNIFWGNKNNNGNVALAVGKGGGTNFTNNLAALNSIDEDNFSNISFLASNTSNSDPLFTDAANGDFTIQTNSPAKDTGDNSRIPSGVSTDLFGNQRIFNTTVDMGAYEFGPAAPVIKKALNVTATNGSVTISPSSADGLYVDGTSVELTATPAVGYQFDGWSGDATGTTNPLTITMDADKTVTAMFSKIQRTLTINATNGWVSKNPNPPGGAYDDGASVELTATPDAGYQFDGWSGDATGTTNPLTITMDTDKTVTAMFSKIQRTLTINATNGSVSTNPNPTGGTYDDGTSVELTATPDAGYQFDGWSGDATGTTNPLMITMDANKTVTAMFSKIQRTLTINATNGSVSTNPNPTGGTYDDGTSVELTATPDAGYQFDGWSGDATGTTNPLTITMDADKTVTANFSLIQRTLTVNAINGTVNISVPTFGPKNINNTPTISQFNDRTIVRLEAIPDAGYKFDGWSGDITSTANPVDVVMDADKTITAMFSAVTASVVDEEFNKEVKIYPIPTSDILNIKVTTGYDIKKVVLYSIVGKKVLETKEKKMNLSSLVSGIYILKVTNSEGRVASRRIIKK